MRNYTRAKIAYEAYRKESRGRSLVSGDILPAFDELSEAIKDAWWAAADALYLHQKYMSSES